MALLEENETEDQEVGSKDGVVDAWYEGIKLGRLGKGFHMGVVCMIFLKFYFA